MEEINDSSYFKSTLSSEDSRLKECLNDAILLSSNDEILSKSNDDIFYDTNEFSFSWNNNLTESDISDISDVEIYKSCSDLVEENDNTSLLTLPSSKTYGKIISDKDVPEPAQNLNNPQNSIKDYEMNKNVPLKIVLKRMFHEILGKYIKEPSTTCSVSEPNNSVEINNNDSFCQLSGSNHSCPTSESVRNVTLPSDHTSADVSNKWCHKKLETILEQSNENCGTSAQQPPLDWSEKCIRKLANVPPRKFNKHWINDKKVFVIGDRDDSTSNESNASCDIEMLSMDIFKKLNDLNNNYLINSIDWNSNTFNINNVLINTNSTNNEEYNLVKSKRLKIPPTIFITPASPN